MSDWKPENSILDAEVIVMAKKSAIAEFNIIERETDAYYVTMRLHHWREGVLHLATRRAREEPRIFLDLGRLVTHIREKYGTISEIKLMLLPVTPVEEKVVLDRRGTNFGGRMPAEDEEKRMSALREVLDHTPLEKRPYAARATPKTSRSKPKTSAKRSEAKATGQVSEKSETTKARAKK